MKYPVKKLLINFGGYTFWGLLFVWGVAALLLKSCESLCYHEVLHTEHSPNGAFSAEIYIGDCGGATTDFYGGVNVTSKNGDEVFERLITFRGRPEETGLEVRWSSDEELVISISDLHKVRTLRPRSKFSSGFNTNYEFRHEAN
ncbi:DUF5412 family protein [Aliidiomarina sanyensis]|nr:hypothetical protein [Aliidiomarina sanyensis]